jgi:hypothetical protein
MDKISLHELKDIAHSTEFALDLLEQGHIGIVASGDVSKEDYLLDQLRVLIQHIEDTVLNITEQE